MERAVAATMLRKHGGLTQREVGRLLGNESGAAVGQQLKKIREALGPGNKALEKQLTSIGRRLGTPC